MIRKNKFGVIRAILQHARCLNLRLNKRDKRLGYIIQSHQFFIWNNEEEFNSHIVRCLNRLLPVARRRSAADPTMRSADTFRLAAIGRASGHGEGLAR